MSARDNRTISSFGDEWTRFDQSDVSYSELEDIFKDYFLIFPWDTLNESATGFDMGCGTGRWAKFVAPRVGHLHCIEPSQALDVAINTLADLNNVSFHRAYIGDPILPISSQDFGYCLGVIHHVPDAAAAIRSCVALLKPGAPFLVYLYYTFDNRSLWYRLLWSASDLIRKFVSRLPSYWKNLVTDFLALIVYLPLARLAWLVERVGIEADSFPLAYYRRRSFYTMRTDSRDRFGTPLEKRFSRNQIEEMLRGSGLVEIQFSPRPPFWCAVGIKA